jgi:hypothetical protein
LVSALYNVSLDEQQKIDEEDEHRTLKERLIEYNEKDIEWLKQTISARMEQGKGETLFEIGLEGIKR